MSKIKIQNPSEPNTRGSDGILYNFQASYAPIYNITHKDVLKPVHTTTYVCIICKEFTKVKMHCGICGRTLHNFGNKVRVPKKNSTKQWKLFVNAYAYRFYAIGKNLMIDDILVIKQNLHYDDQITDENLKHVQAWAMRFDKFLQKYRK